MASGFVDTNYKNQQEGGDTLKAFLLEHKSTLKKGVDPIYNVLTEEAEIEEYEEVLPFSEVDLRKILDPNKQENTKYKIKDVHVGRFINLLRTIPDSQIFKEAQKTKEIVKVLISTEEEQAMNKISESSARIEQNMVNIDNTIDLSP